MAINSQNPYPDAYPPLPAKPSFASPIAVGDKPKRIPAWEELLTRYGYTWNDKDSGYKNPKRKTILQFFPDNSAKIILPNGEEKNFPNIGAVVQRMELNKQKFAPKRHPKRKGVSKKKLPPMKGEPEAQVTSENFKTLFEFFYT
jgi:uncharacterized protein YifE (UPF0438 family)